MPEDETAETAFWGQVVPVGLTCILVASSYAVWMSSSLWEMRQHLEPSKKGRCGNRGTTRPRMELPPSWVPSGAALATSLSRILYRSWRGRSRTACPTSVMSYALLNKSGKSSKSGESLKSGKSSNAR